MDLAREGEFELGGLKVRPAFRQVDSPQGSETLEPRIMQVLVALARQRGDVVSRDQLIEACWDGVAVGEDSISRCIYRLRKLGDATGAFRLETVTKVGYRLVETGPVGAAAGADPAAGAEADVAPPGPGARGVRDSRLVWGGAAAAVVIAALLFFLMQGGPGPIDPDQVMARLSDRLRQTADAAETRQIGETVQALGISTRAEERSAYEALASGDSIHALEVLENLASELEAQGERQSAAAVYRKAGAIAVLVDHARAMSAQMKSFRLDPTSLAAFQGMFIIQILKGQNEAVTFATDTLKDPSLTPRMRGWVLAHRAFAEADWLSDADKAKATLAELDGLAVSRTDPAVRAAGAWARAILAYLLNDLSSALALARESNTLWAEIPERTSRLPELVEVRVLHSQGDWARAFANGVSIMERRSREGDLLPAVISNNLCEVGVFLDKAAEARPYCDSSAARGEHQPGVIKAYTAISATARGDFETARKEFALAQAMVPGGGTIPLRVKTFEAWSALQAGDTAYARQLTSSILSDPAYARSATANPKAAAELRRFLAGLLIRGGEPRLACAPLTEAERIYGEIGGDAGREASRSMRIAAGCAA